MSLPRMSCSVKSGIWIPSAISQQLRFISRRSARRSRRILQSPSILRRSGELDTALRSEVKQMLPDGFEMKKKQRMFQKNKQAVDEEGKGML